MPSIHGSKGVVKVGSDVIARITDWSLDESADFEEDTTMGDNDRTYNETAMKSATCSISCQLDPTDTDGQGALVSGGTVTVTLLPDGDAASKPQRTGTVRITQRTESGGREGIVSVQFQGQFSGAVTHGTVPA